MDLKNDELSRQYNQTFKGWANIMGINNFEGSQVYKPPHFGGGKCQEQESLGMVNSNSQTATHVPEFVAGNEVRLGPTIRRALACNDMSGECKARARLQG
jgi:hypothetical protein